jgi:hypothetical protein
MDRHQMNILAIGSDAAILQVFERLINSHAGWAATVVATESAAIAAFDKTEFRIVFVCAGITAEEEEALRLRLRQLHPETVVTRHFGGGSGLLENEVLAIINA